MKRILTKWDNTSIKHKLFLITSGLLVALAIIIYLILSNSLPSYYHQYKIQSLEAELNTLIEESVSHDTKELEVNLYHLVKRQNIALLLTSPSGRIVYGNNEILLLKLDKYKEHRLINISKNNKNNNSSKEYYTSRYILTNDIKTPYKLDILMPLQPVDEASMVIKKIMPYILLVAVFIGMIGAFIYSSTVTKPLIEIIESEREQEQRRRDFIATISHELKTPITIISGQIEGMMYNIGKYKDRDTYLQKSYESTQELKDLVNEMIEVSKAEIIKQDLSLTKVDLSKLLHKLVERQMFLIDDNKLLTELKIENNISIIADEEKLTRAINNIINNAIKYSPEGEMIKVRLYKQKIKRNPKVYLEIENTGVKIEQKYLEDIFNPFYRIEKSRSRKTGGSGLGLYIVSNILKGHGFDYEVKSKENSVVFIIRF